MITKIKNKDAIGRPLLIGSLVRFRSHRDKYFGWALGKITKMSVNNVEINRIDMREDDRFDGIYNRIPNDINEELYCTTLKEFQNFLFLCELEK